MDISDFWDEILLKSLIFSTYNENEGKKRILVLFFLVKQYHTYTSANEIKIVSDLLDTLSAILFHMLDQHAVATHFNDRVYLNYAAQTQCRKRHTCNIRSVFSPYGDITTSKERRSKNNPNSIIFC